MKANILIVDDSIENLQVLSGMLEERGYLTRPVSSGTMALQTAKVHPPDLVLLDVNMPEMDGYEVCRRFKAEEKFRNIPIIFVSALHDTADKLSAFRNGGVDYITKPFQLEEVYARVDTQLNLKAALEQLQVNNNLLQENLRLREEVEAVNRHDLKNPLVLVLNLPSAILARETLSPASVKMLGMLEDAGRKMLDMINRSIDMFKMEKGIYEPRIIPIEVLNLIGQIVNGLRQSIETKKLSFEMLADGQPAADKKIFVQGEELLLYSLFSNLLKNAVEASPDEGKISISLFQKDPVHISIQNSGVIPEEIRGRFFQKYSTAGKAGGTGLGAYSARLIALTLKGSIDFDTSQSKGTTITVTLNKSESDRSPAESPII